MKARLVIATAALLLAGSADAQSLFGSYSAMRLDDTYVHGFDVGFTTRPLVGPMQLTVEGTSHFGLVQGEDFDELAFLAGPSFAFRRGSRLVPFVHGKAGIVRSRRQVEIFGIVIGSEGVCDESCPAQTAFAAEAGGGHSDAQERRGCNAPLLDLRPVGGGECG